MLADGALRDDVAKSGEKRIPMEISAFSVFLFFSTNSAYFSIDIILSFVLLQTLLANLIEFLEEGSWETKVYAWRSYSEKLAISR